MAGHRNTTQTSAAALAQASATPPATQVSEGESAAVAAPEGELAQLTKFRAEWEALRDDVNKRAADLDAREKALNEFEKAVEEKAAAQQMTAAVVEVDPGAFAVYYRDENNVVARSEFADIDELIGAMKVARRDWHLDQAEAAGFEVAR